MADTEFTAEEFASWIPSRDAYSMARESYGNFAASTILNHLATDLIQARAAHFFVSSQPQRDFGYVLRIPREVWEQLDHANYQSALSLWTTNNAEVSVNRSTVLSKTYKLFGIRFDPAGVRAMLPSEGSKDTLAAEGARFSIAAAQPEPEQKRPQVAQALLNDWFALYKRAFPGVEDTESKAIESAVGMFPGKFVSRQRVRELRGAQKRGPKPSGPAK